MGSSLNNINFLTDSLLSEIFRRLPCLSLLRAKCVCKRWFSLLSDPYFLQIFINYHDNHCQARYNSVPPFTLLYEFSYRHRHLTQNLLFKLHAFSKHSVFKTRVFHLDFLPSSRPWESLPIWVVASHNDLLVCCDPNIYSQSIYYICNPLTKQWVSLPPITGCHVVADTAIGFISFQKSVSQYSYKLVRVLKLDSHPNSHKFEVEVFCFEMGEWSKFMVVSSPRGFKRTWQFKPNAVTFRNKLHWLVNGEIIVVLDVCENNTRGLCRVIDLPFELNSEMSICLGSCQDHLKVSQIVRGCLNHKLVVWKLQDYETSNWQLEYEIDLKDMVFGDHLWFHDLKPLTAEVLAYHPSDGEILYLRFDNLIVMCNMGKGKLEVVSKCLEDSSYSIGTRGVFLLLHPCWPSLVRPLLPRQ